MVLFYVRHGDKHRRQHGEYHCLDVAYQYLEHHHEDAQENADGSHNTPKHITHHSTKSEHDEDDARQRDGDDVTCQHVGEESDHQGDGLREDAKELNKRHERNRKLEPQGNIAPKDFFPVGFRTRHIHDDECAEGQEHRTSDIASQVTTTWRKRHDTHDVCDENEEEARHQVRSILWSLCTQ